MKTKIQETAFVLSASIGAGYKLLDFAVINASLKGIVENPNLVYLGIFNKDDKPTSTFNPRKLKLNLPAMIHNQTPITEGEVYFYATPVLFEDEVFGNLLIGYSLEEIHEQIRTNTFQGLFICLALLLISTLLIIFLSQVLTKNIIQLKDAAKNFVPGRKHITIPIQSEDEVGELSTAFNHLTSEINSVVKNLEKYSNDLEKKNQELGDFINIASHDINEPLVDIANLRDLMETSVSMSTVEATNQKYANYLETMQTPLKRIRRLLTDLLKYSYVMVETDYQFQSVPLKDLIGKVISELDVQIQKCGANIEVGPMPTIEAHPFHIQQVFTNLISNSLKFQEKNVVPLIQINSETFQDKEGKTHCKISIQDNGIGFDSDKVQDVFKPLVRLTPKSKYEGTGMGLSICKRIIERHGGTITAESSPGRGTTFIIILPTRQKPEN